MAFASLAAGFLPVLLFLAALRLLDSYKLVPWRMLLGSLVAGALAAGLAFVVNSLLFAAAHVGDLVLGGLVAPVVEESLKAGFIIWLLRTGHFFGLPHNFRPTRAETRTREAGNETADRTTRRSRLAPSD